MISPNRLTVLLLSAIQVLWPLNSVTLYAQYAPDQSITPLTELGTDGELYETSTISNTELGAFEGTIYYPRTDTEVDGGLSIINGNWVDRSPTSDQLKTSEEASNENDNYSGVLRGGSWFRPENSTSNDQASIFFDENTTYLGPSGEADESGNVVDPGLTLAEQIAAKQKALADGRSIDEDCGDDEASPLCSSFQQSVDKIKSSLASIGAFERRLVVDSGTGRAVLLGEQCDPNEQVTPAQNVIVNDQCDRTPRTDARLILLLDYLLRSKDEGGAGREFIELSLVARFSEEPKSEDATYIDGVSGKCVIDPSADATDVRGISTCIRIKAIDRVRITTRIKKYGVFGTSTKYRYKAPIPIKVAWQSDEGQQQIPLPAISTQELIGNYGIENLLQLLEQEDFLSDPDFSGRPLQSIGLGDIARFLGGRLLKQLMDGQNIANFNISDTIEDFGIIALAGALNIDPLVLRGANSLADIEIAQGRSWTAEQIGLDRPLSGTNSRELFSDVARQQIGKLLDIKPYVLENYTAGEFISRLGQGLIEKRLPVTERSFSSNDLNEVKRAASIGRFNMIFPAASNAQNEAQLAEIDERLGIPIGSTANFVRNGNVLAYKEVAGQAVWANYFGRYSDNTAGGFAPEYARTYLQRIVTDVNAQPIGDLTKAWKMTGNDSALIVYPVGLSEEDSGAIGTITTRLSELNTLISAVHSRVSDVINSLDNCPSPTYDASRPVIRCSAGYGSGYEINLIQARLNALNLMPVDQFENALDAIIRKTDDILTENSWNGEYVVLPSEGSQYRLSITAAMKVLADSLQRSRDHIANYRTYGSNSNGSSQRIDQLMNLPAGTVYKLLNGGQEADDALVGAGIRTVANYLPTSNDRARFEMLATSAVGGIAQSAVITDTKKQFLSDVFLTQSPNSEFRRIGRRILINNLSESAQAENFTQSGFWSDIMFYVDRYETINTALNAITSEYSKLTGLISGLSSSIQSNGNAVGSLANDLQAIFIGINPNSLTLSSARGIISEKREKLYQLRNASEALLTSIEDETNGLSGRLETSVNNILAASRAIEQSVMEILEGRPVTTIDSSLPESIQIPDVDLGDFQTNRNGQSNANRRGCSYTQRQMRVLTMLYGDLRSSFNTNSSSSSVIPRIDGDALKKIFITLGSAKLAELLGLPMESFLFFSQSDDKTIDNFFISVARGQILSQCQNPEDKTTEELKEMGRNLVAAHAVTTLASKLGINLPDWVNAETIAQLLMGRVDEVLLAVGSNQLENLLDLPSGTVTRLVRPEGTTATARSEDRQRAIIEIVLAELDVELDLPAGFTLTGDLVLNMGLARIEGVLGLERGQLQTNTSNASSDTARWSISNVINNARTEAMRRGSQSNINDEILANDEEITLRSQIISALGMSLPLGVTEMLQHLDQEHKKLVEAAAGSSNHNLYYMQISYENYQKQVLESLTSDLDSLFVPGLTLVGSPSDPNNGPEAEAEYDDSVRRTAAFERRLAYLDLRLGLPDSGAGTTKRWLIGEITTTQFARQVGGGAAEQLGTSAFIAFLDRVGAEGPWVDAIKNRETDPRTGLSNLDLLKDVMLGRRGLNGDTLAQLFSMMSQALSFDLDDEVGFEVGTIANVIANPDQADKIVFDQGVRIFAQQVLHFDITNAPDSGETLKRIASALIYGATYNKNTGRFEGVGFNGINLNGGQAVAAAAGELTRIAQDWVNSVIPREEMTYFQVPITMLFDAVYGKVASMGGEMDYVSLARSQNNLRIRMNQGIASPEDVPRLDTLGSHNSIMASAQSVDLPAAIPTDNNIFGLNSLDQFITQRRDTAPTGNNLTQDEVELFDHQRPSPYAGYMNSLRDDPFTAKTDYTPPANTPNKNPTNEQIANAEAMVNRVGETERSIRNAQNYWQNTLQKVIKAAVYASVDYGLDQLLNLPPGVIRPGIAQILFEGTVSAKVSVLLDIGINYLLENVEIPDELRFLANYDNLRQATAFFLNQEGRGQLLAQAFSPGGLFNDIQDQVFPRGLFGEITLPQGTFGAMVGLIINGNAGDFTVNGTNVTGLGNLFNTKWVLEVGFNYIGKLIGIDTTVLTETFRLTYDFCKAFQAWNTLSNMEIEEIAGQIANTPGFTGDSIEAAHQKIAQAHDLMVTAAIAIGIYVINLAFGEEINKFETAIGLPPGTITQGLGLALTALLVGTGPMFFVGLGIFLLTTLLGFGFVRTTIRGTADGYYPFVGELGSRTKANQGGVPYEQYPSADVTDDEGAVIASKALGQFDPTKAADRKEGFKKAAQQKVKGLISDVVNTTRVEKYLRSIGAIDDNTSDSDRAELVRLMRPNQIITINSKKDDGKLLYIDEPEIIGLNRTYFNATGTPDNKGYCNTNYPAGICASATGGYVTEMEINY